HPCELCIKAIILGLVGQLWQQLEEPGHDASLRVLDITGLPDVVSDYALAGMSIWLATVALAKACVDMSKLQ
ncbi:LRC14 protein, partial [Passerina amoena]|nr:LRC14 protein [Passerina amoena]